MIDREKQIAEWRAAILRGRAVVDADADELEGHLRDGIAELEAAGLTPDEAFLVSVRRLGEVDRLTAEYARAHADRLWKQLPLAASPDSDRPGLPLMLVFAALAAVLIQVGRVLATSTTADGIRLLGDPTAPWFLRDAGLFVLPVLAAYFAVARRMPARRSLALLAVTVLLAAAVNLFPFAADSSSGALVGIYLPVALWFVVGVAYLGGQWRASGRTMDFIRFSGEWLIYFALIALGGGVLVALTLLVLTPIAPQAVEPLLTWALPSGAAGAVVVAAWLVEAKKSVVENLAPVLTAIFTPLFAVMLVGSAVGYAVAGVGRAFDRDLLTVFDVLLLVVVALVVYGISARVDGRAARAMDVIRVVAVTAAIVLDLLVLVSMLARLSELGATPNRLAALGLNLVLLVNLAGTALLTFGLLRGRTPAARLESWQTGYLPVFAGWTAVVLLVLPPVFGFA